MVRFQNFSASNFESNMKVIGEQIEGMREGRAAEQMPEREAVRESLKVFAPTAAGGNSGVTVQDGAEDRERPDFLPNYIGSDRENDVRAALDRLVGAALHGNLVSALRDAKRLSPFLEDAFHDALIDKIVPEMKRRKIL